MSTPLNYQGFSLPEPELRAIETFSKLTNPGGAANVQTGAIVSDPVSAPNAQGVLDALTAATAPIATTYANIIPLDKAQGRDMGVQSLLTSSVFTPATTPAPVASGYCVVTLIGDGSHYPDLTAFALWDGAYTYSTTLGAQNELTFFRKGNTNYVLGHIGPAIDLSPPTLLDAHIPDSDHSRLNLHWSEPIATALPAGTAFATGSHPYTAHTRDDSTHSHLITSSPFVYGESGNLAYTKPGVNNLTDVAGNELANFGSFSLTNDIAQPVPGQVTGLTSGLVTSTTIPLSWSAPSGTPTDYKIEYKLNSSGTWLTFADGTSTATSTTVTGLTLSSSYDFRVSATNAAGYGAVSSTLTVSTAGSGIVLMFEDHFNGANTVSTDNRAPDTNNTEGNLWHASYIGTLNGDGTLGLGQYQGLNYTIGSRASFTVDITFRVQTSLGYQAAFICIGYQDDNNSINTYLASDGYAEATVTVAGSAANYQHYSDTGSGFQDGQFHTLTIIHDDTGSGSTQYQVDGVSLGTPLVGKLVGNKLTLATFYNSNPVFFDTVRVRQ